MKCNDFIFYSVERITLILLPCNKIFNQFYIKFNNLISAFPFSTTTSIYYLKNLSFLNQLCHLADSLIKELNKTLAYAPNLFYENYVF